MKTIFMVCVATMLLSVSFFVQADPPDPTPGATKPVREQNLDENGWIAVHEQGTAKVEVQGTADVHVTGGQIDALIPPASNIALPNFSGLEAGEIATIDFATILATTIVIWDSSVTGDGDPEFQLDIRSPLNGGGSIFQYSYDETLYTQDMRSFTHPIPVSGVEIWCKNESANCTIGVAVIGY